MASRNLYTAPTSKPDREKDGETILKNKELGTEEIKRQNYKKVVAKKHGKNDTK